MGSRTGLLEETETERVQRWRGEELERAGYPPVMASELASRPDVDLHAAVELVQTGCDPETACQILL